ncbi:acyl-CoA dehydrogenase family protein [Nocardia miyunensis]|uniref:acyl-CoA dehydrogenase family protein n=1 Tax=Nocardia miyunensis TaxID=282684 RepID=UPI0008361C02|nr:acyl-CoA dehydrogenase family protein [Nocardia miyunensis]
MDFTLPQSVREFRDELRDWLAGHLTEEVIAAGRHVASDPAAFEIVRGWNRLLAEHRWAAVTWPEELGGRGAGPLEQMVYVEETVRARAPMPLNVIGMNNIAPAIMRYGTPEQQRTLLPRMMRAEEIWCQGMSEPEAGSDLASLRTRAVRAGEEFVVTGQKIWTSLGQHADRCQLFVRTDPDAPKHQGISCLIVDMSLPGVEARPLATLTGDTDFAELFFDEVRVPATALLGPLDQGWQVATTTLSHERANAARLYSEMQVRLTDLVRDVAGASTESAARLRDPVTLHRLGGMEVRSAFLRILCQRGISASLAGNASFDSASLAKTAWGELGQDIAALGFDLLGPRGAQGRWARERLAARALTIAGGTTQINKNITARRILGPIGR